MVLIGWNDVNTFITTVDPFTFAISTESPASITNFLYPSSVSAIVADRILAIEFDGPSSNPYTFLAMVSLDAPFKLIKIVNISFINNSTSKVSRYMYIRPQEVAVGWAYSINASAFGNTIVSNSAFNGSVLQYKTLGHTGVNAFAYSQKFSRISLVDSPQKVMIPPYTYRICTLDVANLNSIKSENLTDIPYLIWSGLYLE